MFCVILLVFIRTSHDQLFMLMYSVAFTFETFFWTAITYFVTLYRFFGAYHLVNLNEDCHTLLGENIAQRLVSAFWQCKVYANILRGFFGDWR